MTVLRGYGFRVELHTEDGVISVVDGHDLSVVRPGSDVEAVRQGVTIGAHSRKPKESPILGNRVDVGAGAVIVGKVKIGDDVAIGANTVVTTNIPSGSIVVSPPARVIPQPPSARTAEGSDNQPNESDHAKEE